METDEFNAVTAKNVRGLHGISRENAGEDPFYYLYNAHGDVTKLVDELGNVLTDYSYDPFGNQKQQLLNAAAGNLQFSQWQAETQQINNPFRYCGEYLDSETGNYYLRARYYDPAVQRFISEDAYKGTLTNPLTLNWYTYCLNNPILYVDPSGYWAYNQSVRDYEENAGNKVIFNDQYHSITVIERNGAITKYYESHNGKGDYYIDKNNVARFGQATNTKNNSTQNKSNFEKMPVVSSSSSNKSNISFTYSQGANFSVSPGMSQFSGSIGVSVDTKGNLAIQGSLNGGVTSGSPNAAITTYRMITNAPNVENLAGSGYQLGGSASIPVYGIPLSSGAEANIFPDTKNDKNYYGITQFLGIGTPGIEFHAEWGQTSTLLTFNVFDILKKLIK